MEKYLSLYDITLTLHIPPSLPPTAIYTSSNATIPFKLATPPILKHSTSPENQS